MRTVKIPLIAVAMAIMVGGLNCAWADEQIEVNGVAQGSGASASSGSWEIGASIGLDRFDPKDFAANLETFLKNKAQGFVDYLFYTGSSGTAEYKAAYAKGAGRLEAHLGYRMASALGFIFSAGVHAPPDTTATVQGSGEFNELIDYSLTQTFSLTHFMGGVTLSGGSPDSAVAFRGSLLVGPLFVTSNVTQRQTFKDPYYAVDDRRSAIYDLEGSVIAFVLGGEVSYNFTHAFGLFVDAGYRVAKVDKMIIQQNVDWDGDGIMDLHLGDPYKDTTGSRPIVYDFSGGQLGFGLRFRL